MVSFTALASVIFATLLSTTVSSAPAIVETRQTSSVLDFTLYKTTQPGDESQCWTPVDSFHVAPTDLQYFDGSTTDTVCNQADFYVVHIDATHQGYDCYGMYAFLLLSRYVRRFREVC